MLEAKYNRLNEADRDSISRGLSDGLSSSAIALSIGRATSTVTREMARNYGRRLYRAVPPERKAYKLMGGRRRGKRKLYADGRLRRYVEARLAKAWSPDEIAAEAQSIVLSCRSPVAFRELTMLLRWVAGDDGS